jgi:hypothetical protein
VSVTGYTSRPRHPESVKPETPQLSQDAAIVLALAQTAIPFATSREDEAERWVRVMRMHGQVGAALQALGVGEAPLQTAASRPHAIRLLRKASTRAVADVEWRARSFAAARGTGLVGTADVLFGVLDNYGQIFDRALYIRGTSRDELLRRLASGGLALPQPYDAAVRLG